MIGLDTNVLVRYLAQDDAPQAEVATRLIEQELSPAEPGFVSLVVLAELCWVLKRLYNATDLELAATVADMLGSPQFQLEQRQAVQAACQRVLSLKSGKTAKVGLTDVLVFELARSQGCSRTVSFDRNAVRSAGMSLLV